MKTSAITIRRETTWLDPKIPATLLFGQVEPRRAVGNAVRSERPTARWDRTELLGGVPAHVRR